MKRIMHLTWEFPPHKVGGLASHVYDLSRIQAKRKDEVIVITRNSNGFSEYEKIEGVHVFRFNSNIPEEDFVSWTLQMNFFMQNKAISAVKKIGKPDIIHIHDWLSFPAGFFLKHALRLPLISTMHAAEYGRFNGVHNNLQKMIHELECRTLFESWRIIACSNFMKWQMHYNLGAPLDKINVIPNGVDPKKFEIDFNRIEEKKKYALPYEKIVLFTGRLVHEKGVDVFIGAMPSILYEFPDAKFVIAGGGFTDDFRRIAEYCGVKDKVIFTGYLDDLELKKLINLADVVVVPSRYEPFGIVALEGMSCRKPVVVSDTGGLGEIIEHERDGLKVWKEHSESLSIGIKRVLRDKELSNWLTKNAYEKILTKYNWDLIAKNTDDVYSRVLEEYNKSDWKKN